MRVIAFDISLNSTGVCFPGGHTEILRGLNNKSTMQDRLGHLFEEFKHAIKRADPMVVAKESAVIHPRQVSGARDLLAVHGVLAAAIWAVSPRIDVIDISPMSLKKFARETVESPITKPSKSDMIAFAKQDGCVGDPNSDEADAYWVYRWAMAQNGSVSS